MGRPLGHPLLPHISPRPRAAADAWHRLALCRVPSRFGDTGHSQSPHIAGPPPCAACGCAGTVRPPVAVVVPRGASRWQDVTVTWAAIVPTATRPARHGERPPRFPRHRSRNRPDRGIDVTEKALVRWGYECHQHPPPNPCPPVPPAPVPAGEHGGPGVAPAASHLVPPRFLIAAVISSMAAPAQHVTSLQRGGCAEGGGRGVSGKKSRQRAVWCDGKSPFCRHLTPALPRPRRPIRRHPAPRPLAGVPAPSLCRGRWLYLLLGTPRGCRTPNTGGTSGCRPCQHPGDKGTGGSIPPPSGFGWGRQQ